MKRIIIVCLLLPFTVGCEKGGGPITVTEVRESSGTGGPQATGMSTAERLGVGAGMPGAPGPSSGFSYEVPEGWSELPTTRFREVNLRVAGNPDADCYVSKAGGGVEANVNRWRGQMGQPPLDAAAVEALPRKTLLGEEAIYTDVEGSFTGMGQTRKEGFRMVGLILPTEPQAVFVKMTGPSDVIAQELGNFEKFVVSLSAGASDTHAGMSMSASSPHGGAAAAADLHWTAPEGWSEVPSSSSMRLVTLQVEGAECSVVRLPGQAGGVVANVGMWYGQMGAEPPSEEAVNGFEKIEMLGTQATLVRITGDFQDHSMSGQSGAGYALLGAICPQPDAMVFVKFIGPESVVSAQESAFRAFCASIHSAQH